MAKSYAPFNSRTYDLQFDKIIKDVKGKMGALLEETAKGALTDIINNEPAPFKTGSYIASHRVGINQEDTSDTVFEDVGEMSLEGAREIARAQLPKIKNIKDTDTIIISNSVGYSTKYGYSWARNVEYAGWGGSGYYLVYEKAALKAMNDIEKHVQSVKTTTTRTVK